VPIVSKYGSLNLLEPSGPVKGCNGIAITSSAESVESGDSIKSETFTEWIIKYTMLTFRNPASYIKDGHTATLNTPHFLYFFNKYTY
jgi:hypothetical protein